MRTFAAFVILAACSCFAQSINLGMPEARVHAIYGEPRFYCASSRQHGDNAARNCESGLFETYTRTVAGRRCEMRVRFGMADETMAVEEVQFVFAAPAPVRPVLAALKEAREICAEGCVLRGADVLPRKRPGEVWPAMSLDNSGRDTTSFDGNVTRIVLWDHCAGRCTNGIDEIAGGESWPR